MIRPTWRSLYGLTADPFSAELPLDGFLALPEVEHWIGRVDRLVAEGGFVLVTGESGMGKSAALRQLDARLGVRRELAVATLRRPQSSLPDFYRELGDLYGVALSPSKRWAGGKILRERWIEHIDAQRVRPVLLVDEAQAMPVATMNELRMLAADALDARALLTVVFGGDGRVLTKLEEPELRPLKTRLRARLALEPRPPEQLVEILQSRLTAAGAPSLMTPGALRALADHAAGNLRVLITLAAELLDAAVQREIREVDEALFVSVFAPATPAARPRTKARA